AGTRRPACPRRAPRPAAPNRPCCTTTHAWSDQPGRGVRLAPGVAALLGTTAGGKLGGAMQATERFTRRADQVPAARFFVGDTLRRWGVTSRLDDVVLMTSELFTNAVLHGDGAVQVSLC